MPIPLRPKPSWLNIFHFLQLISIVHGRARDRHPILPSNSTLAFRYTQELHFQHALQPRRLHAQPKPEPNRSLASSPTDPPLFATAALMENHPPPWTRSPHSSTYVSLTVVVVALPSTLSSSLTKTTTPPRAAPHHHRPTPAAPQGRSGTSDSPPPQARQALATHVWRRQRNIHVQEPIREAIVSSTLFHSFPSVPAPLAFCLPPGPCLRKWLAQTEETGAYCSVASARPDGTGFAVGRWHER